MRTPYLLVMVPIALASSVAFADAQPGDLLVVAQNQSVYNIAGGGDFDDPVPFATGLTQPWGICVGPGNEVYVSEGNGEITIITNGGDFTGAPAFATGLEGPYGLGCSPERIVVVEYSSDEVTDITAGGDFTLVAPLAFGFPVVIAAHIDRGADVWVGGAALGELNYSASVWNVTAGGDFEGVPPTKIHEVGAASEIRALTQRGDALLGADAYFNDIIDFGPADPEIFGSCNAMPGAAQGIEDAGAAGLFLAGYWSVFEISAGGPCQNGGEYATVSANGIDLPFSGIVLVRGECGDGIVDAEEWCDGAGETADCDDDCSLAECGDGTLNAAAGEECDDGNLDDRDDCPSMCAVPTGTTGDSGADGSTGPASDTSDTGSDDGSSTTGTSEPGSTATTSDDSTASATTTGSVDDSSPATDEAGITDEAGCGCTSASGASRAASAPLAWLAVALGLLRRRRSRH